MGIAVLLAMTSKTIQVALQWFHKMVTVLIHLQRDRIYVNYVFITNQFKEG